MTMDTRTSVLVVLSTCLLFLCGDNIGLVAARSSSCDTSAASSPTQTQVQTQSLAAMSSSQSSSEASSFPNWVGPTVGNASDSACYRKTHMTKECPIGYEFDHLATCWALCPLEYPVECGMECLPQGESCAIEVLTKISSVATVALKAASSGVFSDLGSVSEDVQRGVKCGQQVFAVVKSIVSFVDELPASNSTNSTAQDSILSVLGQSDLVVKKLPAAVCTCLGLPVPTGLSLAAEVVTVVDKILVQVVEKGDSLLSVDTFLDLLSEVGAGLSIVDLDSDGLSLLQSIIESGATCGTQLQDIVDKATQIVADMKDTEPDSSVDDVRLALSGSDLVLVEIPSVTNACVQDFTDSLDAFATRDSLRKALGLIIDSIAESSDDEDGNALSTADFVLKVADMGLDVLALFDPTGIAQLLAEYIQPICGPTEFIGEVNDGDELSDVLGLTLLGEAFEGTTGSWRQSGDGLVLFTFESSDTEDVTVNIKSGGEKIAEVDVDSGESTSWNSTVAELQDKTLYLNRARPGILGIKGTGGNSMLLWAPRSSSGGHLELNVKINVS